MKRSLDIHNYAIKPLRTERDYEKACEFLELAARSPDAGRLEARIEVVATLIEKYQDDQHLVADVSPGELLSFLIETHGLRQADLKAEIGSQSHVSDIIKGRRKLTAEQIRKLSLRFKIPGDLFLSPDAGSISRLLFFLKPAVR